MEISTIQEEIQMKFEINAGDLALDVEFHNGSDTLYIQSGEERSRFEAVMVQPGVYSILLNNKSFVVGVCPSIEERLNVNGTPIHVKLLDSIHLHLRDLGWDSVSESKAGVILAQIPGLVTKIFHQVGDVVEEGHPLFLMEAMKMENEIKAPVGGVIQKISVQEGQTVEKGTLIIEIA
jgi:biotin carboxyl carrier protein